MIQGNLGYLPIEMQDHILSFISKPKDMIKVATLSSHFYHLMKRRFYEYKYESIRPVINHFRHLRMSIGLSKPKLLATEVIKRFHLKLDRYKRENKDVEKFKFKFKAFLIFHHYHPCMHGLFQKFWLDQSFICLQFTKFSGTKIVGYNTGKLKVRLSPFQPSVPFEVINKIINKNKPICFQTSNENVLLINGDKITSRYFTRLKNKVVRSLNNRIIYHQRRGFKDFNEWSQYSQRSYRLLEKELKILNKKLESTV